MIRSIIIVKNNIEIILVVDRDVEIQNKEVVKIVKNNQSYAQEILEYLSKRGYIKIQNVKTNETKTIEVDGVFPYIGFTPNVKGFNGQIIQDERGFIRVDENMRTSTMGVFAIGDVRVTPLRQVITAVADGAIAGMSAVRYIEELKTAAIGQRSI